MVSATVRAVPFPLGKRQALQHKATDVASLGRWIEPVDPLHPATKPLALVSQHPDELAPSSICDGAGQGVVLDQAGDRQIFEGEGPILLDQSVA